MRVEKVLYMQDIQAILIGLDNTQNSPSKTFHTLYCLHQLIWYLSLYIGVQDFWLAWVVVTVRPTWFFMCSGIQGGSSLKSFLMGDVLI